MGGQGQESGGLGGFVAESKTVEIAGRLLSQLRPFLDKVEFNVHF